MRKPFQSILWGTALLTFLRRSHRLAFAATLEKENEAENILKDMEERVKDLRDEIERVYKERCESTTYDDCIKNNYDDCLSTFPNQQCIKRDEFVMSNCDHGYSCNALWDKTISKVSLPEAVADSEDSDIIERVAETACYTRLAEPYMVEQYKKDEEYWSKEGIQPSWAYFGSYNGLYRAVPAIHQYVCGDYDPRRRPWFVAASSGPKDVVILIDVSKGMGVAPVKMESVKEAAKTIVETLTVHDKFIVMAFTNETKIFDKGWKTIAVANQNGVFPGLISATIVNKNMTKNAIDELEADGITNFTNAFETAFDVIENSLENEDSSTGNIAILFMSDGRIKETGPSEEKVKETESVINFINERRANIDRKVVMFTYSVGDASELDVGKNISCNTGGIWTPVNSYREIDGAMSSYYKLFALDLSGKDSRDNVVWVEPYRFFTRGVMGTTVSVPVYDRSVTPYLFLGVAAVDVYKEAIDRVLGEDATTLLMKWISKTDLMGTTQIALDECQLDALRLLGGGENATCGICSSTSLVGVLPEKCDYTVDSLNRIWDNTDLEERNYTERACCGSDNPVPGTCTVSIPSPVPIPNWAVIVPSAVAGVAVIAVLVLAVIYCARQTASRSADTRVLEIDNEPDMIVPAPREQEPPQREERLEEKAPWDVNPETDDGPDIYVPAPREQEPPQREEKLEEEAPGDVNPEMDDFIRQANYRTERHLHTSIDDIRRGSESVLNELEITRLHELQDMLNELSLANETERSRRFTEMENELREIGEVLRRRRMNNLER